MKKESVKDLEKKLCSMLSKKTPKEVGEYMAKAPINVSNYIALIYLPKQSEKRQYDIGKNLFFQIMKDNPP